MTHDKDYEKFLKLVSENVQKHRKRNGFTQMDMIDFGFNYRHYQRLESGEGGISLHTLFRLAKVFKVSVSSLIDV